MSRPAEAFWLFGGIGAVLLLATALGAILERRHGATPTIANLNGRIRAWWAMIAAIALAFLLGPTVTVALFALVSFAGLREFVTLTDTRRGDHWALAASFFLVLPIQYVLIGIEWYGLYSIFIPVYAFLLLPIVVALGRDTRRFMARIAEVQWGIMIAVYCLSHVAALLTLDILGFTGRNLLLVAFLVIVVQASDVLQYVFGKLMGKRRIAPSLSPSKTVEGTVGGIAAATLLGGALWWITPFAPWQAAALALVICLMGFFGGLVMSAIKRDRGVKDWGWMIEGHGGMLDRVDSVIFAAPVFFHLTRYWWAA